MGHLGTVIVSHYYFLPRIPYLCISSPTIVFGVPTFSTHRVLSSKTTLTMLPRRLSQRLHPRKGPLQESTDNPPLHQPSIQILPTITEELEHPNFKNVPEVQLHQPAQASTTTVWPSQNSSAASSSQTSRGVPRQSPPWAPSLIHMFSGDAELDQVQIHDWDKEVKEDEAAIEEEELARVQQKIERLQ
jgi:hypothetical protein